MAKPGQLPRWATGGGAKVTPEPTEQKKSDGWTASEKPPEAYLNWWQKLVYQWIQYLDNLTNEVMTWAAAHAFNSTVTINTAPTQAAHAARKAEVDAIWGGGSFTGTVNVPTPTSAANAARRDMAGQDGMVTTPKLADGSVTRPKLAAIGQQISGSSGPSGHSVTGGTLTDAYNLSVTITTIGRPVIIGLQSDGSANAARLRVYSAATEDYVFGQFRLLRDAIEVARNGVYSTKFSPGALGEIGVPLGWCFVDTPAAGTYTYKIQLAAGSSTTTIELLSARLVAYEL